MELNGSDYGAVANCGENCIKILIPLVTYFWPGEPLSSLQDGFSCLSWIVYDSVPNGPTPHRIKWN